MATSNRYEFQPPMNMNAIRTSIMQRIKQRNEHSKQPLTPPSSIISKHEIQYLHVDNGLPSPPIESCTFDDEPSDTFEATASNSTIPDSPPSPVMSLSKSSSSSSSTSSSTMAPESSEVIREKIRKLKEEKHSLFQTMKNLLSQPVPVPAPEPQLKQQTTAAAAAAPTATSVTAAANNEKPTLEQSSAKPTVERSRSQSRDRDNNLKARPIIRSRSISHSEFSRPISRYSNYYHERRSPTRFYGNDNRNYPYSNARSSYSHPHTSVPQSQNQNALSSSPSSLNMSRRAVNSNSSSNSNINSSSYVSSRSQLAGRPSSMSASIASASTSSTFRHSDRHSRY
ncbi:hypothetical protein [Parasitella parasitica]|uniref:Uncharacterized protein n=1 Tax=Parasitella parasitica TaxID=35722 RepID=A0A0B7MPN2_9FUNG|nr:hypothetical protein [Parasitella parasitica]